MPDTAVLARREGVELVRTGTWALSSGTWDAAPGDLTAAVASLTCPAIQKPIVKIGHTDTRFTPGDGEPAIGWYDNLRIADGGHTLVGDQVAPSWLTDVQAAAWPNRSIEGTYNKRCGLGHTHPFVLTAVSLLGVTPPGVATLAPLNSLDDVKALFGLAASDGVASEGEVRIVASLRAAAEVHTGAMVALIPTTEDAERLAVEGGEPADELHVTLAYLGEAADLSDATRQDIIDGVSSAINGMPRIDTDGFALNVFNPGNAQPDRDTCIVLGLSGDLLDAAHTLVGDALAYSGAGIPQQHSPWHCHLSLTYTDDLSTLAHLVDRVGPVSFDRLRIAFAGQHIDIPLIGDPEPVEDPDADVAAADGDDNNLKRYWLAGPGLKKWATSAHPWTALYRHLRKHVGSERAKRIASEWFHEHFGYWPGDRRHRKTAASAHTPGEDTMPNPQPADADRIRAAWNKSAPVQQYIVQVRASDVIVMDETDRSTRRVPVTVNGDEVTFGEPVPVALDYVPADTVAASVAVYASRDESRPDPEVPAGEPSVPAAPAPTESAPTEPTPELPAAEPEPAPSTEPKGEDPVSTLSTDVRSRLGLADDADDNAVLAALVELKSKADQQPSAEQVAASAAARDEMKTEIERLSGELAKIHASAAADAKTALFDAAVRAGKLKPAERDGWEARYDRAPEVITEILASIAPNTAVPVAASGYTGDTEAQGVDPFDADYAHFFGEKAGA
ncbi:phage protease [Micromonospora sp. CA-248212]|uniref:phage protease n=1 Tax=Micromonospora sp. CA-248212 TaxID=3239961 RepID=UPI003D8F45A9